MTQKELLYMEDAIMHEENTIQICNFIIESLEDAELQSFMKKQCRKHADIKEKLLNILKECSK